MNVKAMHYDIKKGLNKVDSQQYRNLRVPEIDRALNQAELLLIKIVAEPRTKNQFGFEVNQRTIDDIRSIVVDNTTIAVASSGTNFHLFDLPDDYMFYLSSFAVANKGNCENVRLETHVRQHDDRHEASPFDIANFEWRETNLEFVGNQIKAYNDGTFTIAEIELDYIRETEYIHNAEDAVGGQYDLFGTMLTGTQDCELPPHIHDEVVDLAILILTGELQIPDLQIKQNKLKLSQI